LAIHLRHASDHEKDNNNSLNHGGLFSLKTLILTSFYVYFDAL